MLCPVVRKSEPRPSLLPECRQHTHFRTRALASTGGTLVVRPIMSKFPIDAPVHRSGFGIEPTPPDMQPSFALAKLGFAIGRVEDKTVSTWSSSIVEKQLCCTYVYFFQELQEPQYSRGCRTGFRPRFIAKPIKLIEACSKSVYGTI